MKYIDADFLKSKLKDVATEFKKGNYYLDNSEQAVGYENALIDFEQIIDSLQQEQLPGIEEHGIPGKDFIPVEWVDACEKYGKWKIVQQVQTSLPDNLEEAAEEYLKYHKLETASITKLSMYRSLAFKAGAKWMAGQGDVQEHLEVALEKASRNVYESWMGGTMDDVRRDMVELGKALNARKEEEK